MELGEARMRRCLMKPQLVSAQESRARSLDFCAKEAGLREFTADEKHGSLDVVRGFRLWQSRRGKRVSFLDAISSSNFHGAVRVVRRCASLGAE